MQNTTITKKENCTNCKACYNACPNNAIEFQTDEYGFEYPFINTNKCTSCMLCTTVCSKTQLIGKNLPKQVYAVQSISWDVSKKSSSGGMFAQLANYVLSQGGVVFGCMMEKTDDKFAVKHICITDKENLPKLQGSKYVQSDINDSYKQVRTYLEQEKKVLFSGTPCQIAALKSYLNKDYDNLLCIDLSCTGVPNVNIFNDYIAFLENKYHHPILDFKFRDKEHNGWHTSRVVVVNYESCAKKRVLPTEKSSYFSLFIGCNTLRESCYNCKYTGTLRCSDITIADAWGIEKEYPQLAENMFKLKEGVSLVLVNTDKGKTIFNSISEKIKFYAVDINKLKQYNHPLRHPSVMTDEREAYLSVYKKQGYAAMDKLYRIRKKITKKSLWNKITRIIKYKKNKVDCLLMTMYANPNYGSVLAAYSLYKLITTLGYSAKIIHYADLKGFCRTFFNKYCDFTDKVLTKSDYKDLSHMTSAFILGSDNLINYKTDSFSYITRNLFNFAGITKKKIMIAGSIGDWECNFNHKNEYTCFKALLKRFDYLSTREKHGKLMFEKVFNCKATQINDPIFYLNVAQYETLIKNVKTDYSNNIMAYVLYPTDKTNTIIKYFEEQNNIKSVKFYGNEQAAHYTGFEDGISVEDWLSAIKNAKLVITDSFHCTAFALMFNKPLICLENTHAPVRFLSLFEALGINIPIIKDIKDISNANFEYDKEKVNATISEIRNFALENIKTNLQKKHNYIKEADYIIYSLAYSINKIAKFAFSIKNEYLSDRKRKVITILGIKIKLKTAETRTAVRERERESNPPSY